MTAVETPVSTSPTIVHHRFTADQYHRMSEIGVLDRNDRVELINGVIVDMSPIGKEHAGVVIYLNAILRFSGPDAPLVSVQNPIQLDDHSEPQPDFAVLRYRADHYRKTLPRPQDVFFLIEIADSSLMVDRRIKAPLYAAAGIKECWIVDLQSQTIEIHRDPESGQYRNVQTAVRPATISPLAFPDLILKLDQLFPG